MPSLRQSTESFFNPLKTSEGHLFEGRITDLPNKDNPTSKDFIHARRRLIVSPASFITAGTVVFSEQGRPFVLADDGSGFAGEMLYDQYRMFEVDQQPSWTRMTTTVDPVTQLERPASPATLGTPWAAFEMMSDQTDSLKIDNKRYRVITGAALQVDDRLGDYRVRSVTPFLGIYLAEVSG